MEFSYLFELSWYLFFVITLIHSLKTSSVKKTVVFFVPALLWGFFVELAGVLFYDLYSYSQHYLAGLFGVPFSVAFGWASIIYLGYYLTTKKLHVSNLLNIDLDIAFFGVFVDFLILEPIALIYKLWIWRQNDFWFEAPFFNFLGWFLVISIFVTSYVFVTKKYEDEKKQLPTLLLLLFFGLIFLQIVSIVYRLLFGWF